MKQLQVTARCKIRDGKLDEFKALASQCLISVRENEKGTLQYDWFFNEDETHCVVRQTYEDSPALLEHIANLRETVSELLTVCDLSTEIFGDPSPELIKAVDGMGVVVYSYFQGLETSAGS